MTKLHIIVLVFLARVKSIFSQDSCATPNGRPGSCVLLSECPLLYTGVVNLDKKALDLAREAKCKQQNDDFYVCCDKCASQCVPLQSCPHILKGVLSLDQNAIETAEKSVCRKDTGTTYVCCDAPEETNTERIKVDVVRPPLESALPDERVCGYQHSDYRIRDRQKISNDEFTWLVMLLYQTGKSKAAPLCLGTLVTHRHVITAARCIEFPKKANYSLTSVRLGEFNLNTDPDCEQFEELNFTYCGESVLEVPIEKYDIHPNYFSVNNVEHGNDIAVIKLEKYVEFTEYIRAICLPKVEDTSRAVGQGLYTSGWGFSTNGYPALYDIKKKSLGTIVKNEECQFSESSIANNLHLCLREGKNASCYFDFGGPLMSENSTQYFLEGIFNSPLGNNCEENSLGAYTSVAKHLEWIKRVILN